MKQLIISLLFYVFLTSWLTAQNTIIGTVEDQNRNTISYANVILLHPEDSITTIRGTLTDETGHFQFEKVPPHSYRILVYMIGYD